MRRSRRKGQLRRVSSINAGSIFAEQDLFFFVAGLGDDAAEGIGEKAAAPELEARARGAIAQNVTVLDARRG